MRTCLFLILVSVATGCTRADKSSPATVHSAKPLSSPLVDALEKSQTFLDLKQRAKKSLAFINEQADGWVTVDIGDVSEDFFHRWATLKIETGTGTIMKLGVDEQLEDKWIVEFQPNK